MLLTYVRRYEKQRQNNEMIIIEAITDKTTTSVLDSFPSSNDIFIKLLNL